MRSCTSFLPTFAWNSIKLHILNFN